MSDQQHEMANAALLRIWLRIRGELVSLQEKAPFEQKGQVVNPISGMVYAQNTGAAALVFATEYVKTGVPEWLSRARLSLESLLKTKVYFGLDEPKWNRLGWHNYKGSMFATGTLLDAFWRAQDLLRDSDDEEDFRPLLKYLETCRIRQGLFTHDSFNPGQVPIPIQNTTAIALYLMEVVAARAVGSRVKLRNECDSTLESLIKGQRADGLWPYTYPFPMQRITSRFPVVWPFLRHIPILRRYLLGIGDESILFGDTVHHCLVLYYLVKSITLRQQAKGIWEQTVNQGWDWIRRNLVNVGNGELTIDFGWEPLSSTFRYANFRDTSAYFLILATLPLLVELDVVNKCDYHKISSGILVHVEQHLFNSKDYPTSIKPYEGPDEILRYILPRVGEASAWKGALLAEFILSRERFKD